MEHNFLRRAGRPVGVHAHSKLNRRDRDDLAAGVGMEILDRHLSRSVEANCNLSSARERPIFFWFVVQVSDQVLVEATNTETTSIVCAASWGTN